MKNYSIEIKWAIIFTIVGFIWMFLEKMVGLHDTHIDKHALYTNFFAIPAIIMVILYMKEKKKDFYGGNMSYKQGFIGGLILTLFIVLLTPLAQWITTSLITPDYFENAIAYAVENNKVKSEEEVRAFFNQKSYMVMSAMGAAFMGVLTSAIVAFFAKTKS